MGFKSMYAMQIDVFGQSVSCHTSAEASIIVRSVSVVPLQLINFNPYPSCSYSYHLLTKWVRITPGTKSFLLVSQDNLNPQYSLYRSK